VKRKQRTLTRVENQWAEAAFGAIFPSNAHPELRTGICDLDVASFLVDLRSRVPYRAALGLRLGIWMVALAPLFVLHRLRTISGLDPRSREVVLAALLGSSIYPVRQLVMLLKAIGALLYGKAASVRAVMIPARVPENATTGRRLIGLGRKPNVVAAPQRAEQEEEAPEQQDEAGASDERAVASVA
jgi:hypothetical protein